MTLAYLFKCSFRVKPGSFLLLFLLPEPTGKKCLHQLPGFAGWQHYMANRGYATHPVRSGTPTQQTNTTISGEGMHSHSRINLIQPADTVLLGLIVVRATLLSEQMYLPQRTSNKDALLL
jgi:hypothetical protein